MYLRVLEMCLEMYELDPTGFLTAPRLAWQGALKKIIVKLDLLTNIDLLSMIENGINVEYVMLFVNM